MSRVQVPSVAPPRRTFYACAEPSNPALWGLSLASVTYNDRVVRFRRKVLVEPSREAPAYVVGLDALVAEVLGDRRRPSAHETDERDRPVPADLVASLNDRAHRDMNRAGDVPGVVLDLFPDVDQLDLARRVLPCNLGRVHLGMVLHGLHSRRPGY